ncbi:MAG: hypothetical protein ACI3YF_10105 [Prevotella sp.]
MTDNTHIQQLLQRYDEGMTSEQEEATLRRLFAEMPTDSLPEEWCVYKAIFGYVDLHRKPSSTLATALPHARKRLRPTLWKALATAACAALVLSAVMHLRPTTSAYAVIDGVLTEDAGTVREEALKALDLMSANQGDCFDALQAITFTDNNPNTK